MNKEAINVWYACRQAGGGLASGLGGGFYGTIKVEGLATLSANWLAGMDWCDNSNWIRT